MSDSVIVPDYGPLPPAPRKGAKVMRAPEPGFGYDLQLFLAGGITGAPEWQTLACERLSGLPIVIYDPRRQPWPDDKSAMRHQIEWEFHRLQRSDLVLFWFPKEAKCPIAMYELGRVLALGRRPVVGIEPGFWKEDEIRIQIELASNDSLPAPYRSLDHLLTATAWHIEWRLAGGDWERIFEEARRRA